MALELLYSGRAGKADTKINSIYDSKDRLKIFYKTYGSQKLILTKK